jgi:hypothetical protein
VTDNAVRADDNDPYSATVKVDATGDNAAKARELARIDGQRRALTAIADGLAGGNGQAKLPKLDDNAITNLVASFEVANERMSAVRYIADYTFHFRPTETQRVLRAAGIAAAPDAGAAGGKPIVVVPVFQSGGKAVLWDDPNPWRAGWSQRPASGGAVRLAVPLGDAGDLAAIDAEKARTADSEALSAIARQNGGDDAVVALAAPRGPADKPTGLDVTVRRYRQGKLVDSHFAAVDANPGESGNDFMQRAANVVAGNIETGWKKEPAARYDQQGSLTAIMPIDSLDDWVRMRERLGSVDTIRKVELMSLSRREATVDIQYLGNVEQLKSSLAVLGLDLVRGEGSGGGPWRLARSETPARQPTPQ